MTKEKILVEALKKHEVSFDINFYIDHDESAFVAIYEAMEQYKNQEVNDKTSRDRNSRLD